LPQLAIYSDVGGGVFPPIGFAKCEIMPRSRCGLVEKSIFANGRIAKFSEKILNIDMYQCISVVAGYPIQKDRLRLESTKTKSDTHA
jgi:hypothetical protein